MPAAKAPTSLRRIFDEIGTVDHVGIEERVAKFTTRSIKNQSKVFGLRLAVTMVDLTTLEGKDTPGKVASPAPLFGQHTAEVLAELGYTEAEIEALAAGNAVHLGDTTSREAAE